MIGTIPFELEQLNDLSYLGLEEGQLSGTIPTQLGTLSKLQVLDLNRNELTGSIPEALYGLTNMLVFDLDSNRLTGTLSNNIGNLNSLLLLQLQTNLLTGTIPSVIGNLNALSKCHKHTHFHFHYHFHSIVSLIDASFIFFSFFSSTITIDVAEFFENDFVGSMPQEICDDRIPVGALNGLTADCAPDPNNGNTIEIICNCCSECYPR